MNSPLTEVTDALQARFLSTVATRFVRAPSISLTSRDVAAPETVMVPTRHGDVRCFVTRAAAHAPLAASGTVPPVHIHVHGGAFLVGAPRQDDHLVRGIAGEVSATVVNVDYSTWPRARYPQAHEECYDVLRWGAELRDHHGLGRRTGLDQRCQRRRQPRPRRERRRARPRAGGEGRPSRRSHDAATVAGEQPSVRHRASASQDVCAPTAQARFSVRCTRMSSASSLTAGSSCFF